MPQIQYPLVNGLRYDWSSVEIRVGGIPFYGVKSISYKHMLDPGEVRGNHAQLIGRTRGKYSAEGNIELYRLEYDALIAQLSVTGASRSLGYLETSFSIDAAYAEPSAAAVSVDHLEGCRIKSADRSNQEGNDALTIKLDLHIMYLLENGQSPLGPTQFLK